MMKNRIIVYMLMIFIAISFSTFYLIKTFHENISPAVVVRSLSMSELVEKINSFTIDLYGLSLNNYVDENIVLSPFNIYVALTMLYEGTESDTRDELGKALGLYNVDVCEAYQRLLSILPLGSGGDTTFYMGNAAWFRGVLRESFREDYIEKIEKCFNGEIKYFDDIDQLVYEVNKWVDVKTNGSIRRLIDRSDVSDFTIAVLVSVIYFKSLWLKEFKSYGEIKFLTKNGWVNVKAMDVAGDHMKIVRENNYVAVEIPYKDTSISMIIIMPNNFTEFSLRYKEYIKDALYKLDISRPGVYAHLIMPKFNVTFNIDMNSYLMKLGIRKIFTPEADLSRMIRGGGGAYVSKIVHQAVIKVNEKGTEAAAATGVLIVTSAIIYPEEVVINKPFIYMLRDSKSKAVLFIGHIIDPSRSE
jgi:serpin B